MGKKRAPAAGTLCWLAALARRTEGRLPTAACRWATAAGPAHLALHELGPRRAGRRPRNAAVGLPGLDEVAVLWGALAAGHVVGTQLLVGAAQPVKCKGVLLLLHAAPMLQTLGAEIERGQAEAITVSRLRIGGPEILACQRGGNARPDAVSCRGAPRCWCLYFGGKWGWETGAFHG